MSKRSAGVTRTVTRAKPARTVVRKAARAPKLPKGPKPRARVVVPRATPIGRQRPTSTRRAAPRRRAAEETAPAAEPQQQTPPVPDTRAGQESRREELRGKLAAMDGVPAYEAEAQRLRDEIAVLDAALAKEPEAPAAEETPPAARSTRRR